MGFGLDARTLVGVKLDSSPDRSGTELLPVWPVTNGLLTNIPDWR
ncbi:Outer membrane porin [Pseudomonas savastanoi pv. phaseolicola]|nr:Outer membrane porin [Pseudomonas savastanoi pv. phaseolicola]KPB48309.1 Outer membrane porin [Pseudomonas savastanoi pv. phaseolicola]KPB64975.1 Outer membrane porin [Pseudomonas savastanoi pv. phaseolicola]KPB65976.1 Outer membrane porin [Pseudomonas amygdali pv. mellea]